VTDSQDTQREKDESSAALAKLEARLDTLEQRVEALEQQKRIHAIDLEIEVERIRGIHPPGEEHPHE
jgi:hypothetical protein